MLVVSRKVGEKILIGDQISVTVIKVSGGGVRIGIQAPKEMAVVREELAKQVRADDKRAIDAANLAARVGESLSPVKGSA